LDGLQNIGRVVEQDVAMERAARLRQDAIAWLSLVSSGTATQADAEALKRWCREDPAHAKAYAQAAHVWKNLGPIAAQAPRPDAEVIARSTQPVIGRRAFLGGSLAASVAGVAYVTVHPPLGLWPSLAELTADVRTATGEQRRIDVADGIAVDLNTRSSLAFDRAAESPRIVLINGEAVIAAGSKIDRSCVVVAGAGRIRAQDAKFDVRHDDDGRVRVVCLDGRVQVEHQAQAIVLNAREQVTYDRLGIGGMRPVDPAVITAWQQGRLVFRKEPLSHVIAEVNRYRPGRIVLMDRQLGARLIDASFQLDRLENVIIYLQQAFDAPVRRLPGAVVLVG
jgi:transmembrane sensor